MRQLTNFGNMMEMIDDAETIAITMHIRPDGDSIGTSLALKEALRDIMPTTSGNPRQVYVFSEDIDIVFQNNFSSMRGFSKIAPASGIVLDDSGIRFHHNTPYTEVQLPHFDLLVVVDAGETHRLGENAKLVEASKHVIVFDHHINPTMPCDLLVNNTTRASCGEMLFEFLTLNNIEITKSMAEAMYTAVASDTGCFLFPNTTHYTHHVASELMKLDIDAAGINYRNFRAYDAKSLGGFTRVLSEIQFLNDGKVTLTYLPFWMQQKYQFDHEEKHRFKKYATDAKGVKVSIFITEQEKGEFNVSLRSIGDINVAELANKFGGGGHKNAAGFSTTTAYKTFTSELLAEVERVV